jgi:hypothetical protein
MKFIFPLPLRYDGTEDRFLQRDGARFASFLSNHGHIGVKLIVDGGDGYPPPQSPLLAIATWDQWCSPAFWKQQAADAILLYGGFDPRLEPVVTAIKASGTPLALKMDSANGILPFPKDGLRLLRTGYHSAHQRNGVVRSVMISIGKQAVRALGRNTAFLKRYLPMFNWITAETPFAAANTRAWLLKQNLPKVADRMVVLGHPVPELFRYDASSPPKHKRVVAVARDWRNPLKGGKMLAEVLGRFLSVRADYTAVAVGGFSEQVRNACLATRSQLASRVVSEPLMNSMEVAPVYAIADILITSSGSEGMPNVATEAACSGCSIVFPPDLLQLALFSDAGGGTMASRRNASSMAQALLQEASAWETGRRNPASISAMWTSRYHTNKEMAYLASLFGLTL